MPKRYLLLFVLLICFSVLYGVKVKKIDMNDYTGFSSGEFQGTCLDNQGRIFIGPEVESRVGPEREYYLSVNVSANDDIYIGTGHKASLFKLSSDGKAQEVFNSESLDIYGFCISRITDEIYVGTSPNGKLYRVDRKGKTTEMFNPDDKFIWDVKEDRTGDIICAVGNSGGVYRVKKGGVGKKIFQSEDSHIISLCITRNNAILAGSGDRGILYQIEQKKVKVLFDSPFDEVKGIAEDKDGNIFFAVTKGVSPERASSKVNLNNFFPRNLPKIKKSVTEKSAVYCIHTNGVVEKIWSSNDEYAYCMAYDKQDNSVLLGTGNSGRIYRLNKDGSFYILYESESAQVFKMVPMKQGFCIISNNAANVKVLKNQHKSSGTYLSRIHDLGIQSRLGRIYWDAETSGDRRVTLFVRAGNSNYPDDTWTPWSAPFTDSGNSTIGMKGYRYMQVKGILNSPDVSGTPYLDRCTVYYIQSNLRPKLKRAEIKKSFELKKSKIKLPQKKDNGRKYLVLKWMASDPNKDKIQYTVSLRKEGDSNWIQLGKELTEPTLKIFSELFEDGRYVAKIVASDLLDNPATIAGRDVLTTSPFVIDSTAPVVGNLVKEKNQISFTVKDSHSIISEVHYSFNRTDWYPIFPNDMINDSNSESYRFVSSKINSSKFILIRVSDEFKNTKVFQKSL